jgi:hypothetical protein
MYLPYRANRSRVNEASPLRLTCSGTDGILILHGRLLWGTHQVINGTKISCITIPDKALDDNDDDDDNGTSSIVIGQLD